MQLYKLYKDASTILASSFYFSILVFFYLRGKILGPTVYTLDSKLHNYDVFNPHLYHDTGAVQGFDQCFVELNIFSIMY